MPLAAACRQHDARLIHISTDYVFPGNSPSPLKEEDATGPLNVYGASKLEGEQKALQAYDEGTIVIRTSWVYSEYGNNFVKTMLKLGSERDELKIIADQVGTPTYAIDLTEFFLMIISSGSTAYGIYHYSNEGVTSWFDFARAVFDLHVGTRSLDVRAVRKKVHRESD